MLFRMCMPYLRIYTHMMTQESFCKELEQVFDQFPKHHIKIPLWQFSATLQRPYNCRRWEHCAISRCRQMNVKWQSMTCHKLIPQDTFTLTIGNECAQENRNDNGDIVVNIVTSKNLTVKSIVLPYLNPDQCTWTSTNGRIHNQIKHVLMKGEGTRTWRPLFQRSCLS